MSGAVFAAKGASGGPAPRAYWMHPLADRLTMLSPAEESDQFYPSLVTNTGAIYPCLFTNLFLNYQTSFGGFTTAPDGTTNTAQKIVEDSSNNAHYVGAMIGGPGQASFPIFRIAGVFRAAERTRIYYLCGSVSGPLQSYSYIGFDLAGNQIAYGPTILVGDDQSHFNAINSEIHDLGNNWRLCIYDMQFNTTFGGGNFFYRIGLDSGSGTAAASQTYTGNGSSGVYGWKHSMLPRQAWNISGTTTYFDDFNDPTLPNIDLNNTKAPGFQIYVDGGFDHFTKHSGNFIDPIPPGSLSASGSVLFLPPQSNHVGVTGPNIDGGSLCNATQTGPGTFQAGFEIKSPCYLEISCVRHLYALPYPSDANETGDRNIWFFPLEWVANQSATNGPNYYLNTIEYDTSEEGALLGYQNYGMGGEIHWFQSQFGFRGFDNNINMEQLFFGLGAAENGCYTFDQNKTTGGPDQFPIASGGSFYVSDTQLNPPVTAPPSLHWATYTYPAGGILQRLPPVISPQYPTMHVQGKMFLPYNPLTNDRGCFCGFDNGLFTMMGKSWAPAVSSSGDATEIGPHTTDWMRLLMLFSPGVSAGSGLGWAIDWIRMTK